MIKRGLILCFSLQCNFLAWEHLQARSQGLNCSKSIVMASKSLIKRTQKKKKKHTKRPSKQEPEWKPTVLSNTVPSNTVPTPDHYGPHPRQTKRRWWEASWYLSSSVSAPPTSFVPLHSPFNYSTRSRSASPAIITILPNSKPGTAQWVLASRELHMLKKPMDVEFITRLADIWRLADGNSSTS